MHDALQEEGRYPMREERHSLVKREQLCFSRVSVRPKTGHVMASRESGRLREGGRESKDWGGGQAGPSPLILSKRNARKIAMPAKK